MPAKETNQTFLLVANQMQASTEKEIQLLPYGKVESTNGGFTVDEESISLIMQAFAKQKNDTVIDYEHQTLTSHAAPAAGWIKELYDRGKNGIWALVDWTQKAAGHIAAKEYQYFSPVVLLRKSDRKAVALHSGGLTNKPAIDGMQPGNGRARKKSPSRRAPLSAYPSKTSAKSKGYLSNT